MGDNIKIDLEQVRYEHLFTSLATISFARRTVLHRVRTRRCNTHVEHRTFHITVQL